MKWPDRILSLLLTLSLIVGSLYLVQASLINAKAVVGQWLIENAWERTSITHHYQKPWPWADTYPVAKLHVPRLGKEIYVLNGASGHALAFGPGMSTYLNEGDDQAVILIQAHRDTHFEFFPKLEVGDVLELEQTDGTRHFVVEQKAQFQRPVIELSEPDEQLVLLLSTCSGQSEQNPDLREVLLARSVS
jgi:sortase A